MMKWENIRLEFDADSELLFLMLSDMVAVVKMTLLLKAWFWRICKTPQALLDLEALQNVAEIVDISELFFNVELSETVVKEAHMEQFLCGHELCQVTCWGMETCDRKKFVLYWVCLCGKGKDSLYWSGTRNGKFL